VIRLAGLVQFGSITCPVEDREDVLVSNGLAADICHDIGGLLLKMDLTKEERSNDDEEDDDKADDERD